MVRIFTLILFLFLSLQLQAQCWKKVSASKDSYYGPGHTLAIHTDGSLWAFGNNSSGELGDGTTTNQQGPIQIGADRNWAEVFAMQGVSYGLKTDGTLLG